MATTSFRALQAFVTEIGLEPIPSFADADVLNNLIDVYHSYLAEHLQKLVECDSDLVFNSIQPSNTIENGDLDIVLPKLKLPGVSPKELAGELLKKFQSHPLFAAPFKDGIHIRFLFSTKTIPRLLLPYIYDRKATYGGFMSFGQEASPEPRQSKVVVEFSSPNIAREFTGVHLRSTILGAFVSNIYETMGWSVVRVNYLGDWGKNLGLLGLGWKKYSSEKVLDEQAGLFRYIHELYTKMEEEVRPEHEARKKTREDGQDPSILENQGLLAERDAYSKQMENGEPESMTLWKRFRDVSIEYYQEAYARLNIKFDEYSGESQVSLNSEAITEVESVLKDRGVYEEQDGAWVIDFDKHGEKKDKHGEKKLGTVPLRDRNGSTTYLLRDIATVFDRLKTYSFDKMVYVVGEQEGHFRQLIKAVELMGRADVANKLQHVSFARAGGRPASFGNAQLLGDVLDQCERHMHDAVVASPDDYQIENCEAVSRAMGINSLVLQELASKKGHNGLDFNLLTLAEGETGTGLQLCYARLCSTLANIRAHPSLSEIPHIDYSSLGEPPFSELLRLMARYPEATHAAFKTLDSGTVLSYLFRVAEELTSCLDEADEEESEGQGSAAGSMYEARASLYEGVRQVLENGMKLLGTTPISK